MEKLLLDTNVLIQLVRGNNIGKEVQAFVNTLDNPQVFISVVAKAEAESLVVQWGWGERNVKRLRDLMDSFICIDVDQQHRELLEAYILLDAFSQRKQPGPDGKMLKEETPRNMGKNDLWIAATAHALEATLLTTDGDFDHLNEVYLKVKKFKGR